MDSSLSRIEKSNIELITRWVNEIYNGHHLELLTEFLDPNFIAYYEYAVFKGIDSFRDQFVKNYLTAFPNGKFTITETMARDDRVVARILATGIFQGELLELPTTNEIMCITATSWYQIAEGRILELKTDWSLSYALRELLYKADAEIKKLKNIAPNSLLHSR